MEDYIFAIVSICALITQDVEWIEQTP